MHNLSALPGSFVLCCALLFAGVCKTNTRSDASLPPSVTVAAVDVLDGIYDIEYPGLVKASKEVGLSFKVAGTLSRVYVKEGDRVRKGTLVAMLDTVDYRNQLNATTAEYEAVMAEAGRVVDLFQGDATTRSNYDKAVAGMRQIESKLKYHQNQLDYCYLRAPVDGVVGKCRFHEHENVSAGMQVIQMLGSGSPEVEIHISDIIYINRERISGFSACFSIYPGHEFSLVPLSWAPSANANQLYTVRLKIDNPDNLQILQGMNVSVTAHVATGSATFSVPSRSVFHDGEGEHVFAVGENGTVFSKRVKVLEIRGDGTTRVDSEDLTRDDLVITSGISRIKEGDNVRPIPSPEDSNVGGLL